MDADVIVVGAGLAGLRCARALMEAGREVFVLEGADAVGGRVRTDVVDGFLVDRGFQLLNPAYPAVRRWVDVDALDLQPFGAGVAARTDDGVAVLGHPLAAPGLLASTLAAAWRRPGELAAVARWLAPLAAPRRHRALARVLAGRADVARSTALDRAGVDGLLRRVLEEFLAGVLLEDDGTTSDRFTLLLVWMFVRGVPALPAGGMQCLPEQLAGPLGDAVRLGHYVERVAPGVVNAGGRTWTARHVVVATGAPEAGRLTGLVAPSTKGVVTTWWSVPEADLPSRRRRLLHVDARRQKAGPLVNAAVVSAAAPGYAPAGRHLVQGSALLAPGRRLDDTAMRRHAGDLLGLDSISWEVVARHEVPDALPVQPVPTSLRHPLRGHAAGVADGLVVCGDQRDTGSLQGELVSGERAARTVLDDLP